jgi:uncharacterized protein with von Willebrand factor type A (vWA) domain
MMYPFASLPENLAAFCAELRHEHGFLVGPRELRDAARALAVTPIDNPRAVRDALCSVLSSSRDDVVVFDRAFRAFFLDPSEPHLDAAAVSARGHGPPVSDNEGQHSPTSSADVPSSSEGEVSEIEDRHDGDERSVRMLRSSYSPLGAEGPSPELVPPDAAWQAGARAVIRRLRVGLSRRWRPAARGERFDLRRTLRTSLHTGGEAVLPRWRARQRRQPRIVVLVDGSRSMGTNARPALQVAVALASVTPRVETFTFSTELQRVTPHVRRAALGERRRLPPLHHAWGGGTGIGVCLREFATRFGDRLLGRDTVVVIASDGLDVGAPEALRGAMAYLHRHSASIVWLNPLLESSGYEPTALGMRTARPYVTTFAYVHTAPDLLRLSVGVRS